MDDFPQSESFDSDRLLRTWRWLCPQQVDVIDRNLFGDLFLRESNGKVLLLDVRTGTLSTIADSEVLFRQLSSNPEFREDWFRERETSSTAERGLRPGINQCIRFSIPAVFAEGGSLDLAYVADLYEHVGFLGDLHEQIAKYPDGTKIKLVVKNLPARSVDPSKTSAE